MSVTAIKSFATFSLCKTKDLLQFDLAYIHPVLSDWIKLKKQISGFQSNSTSSLVFKIRIPLPSQPPKSIRFIWKIKETFSEKLEKP